jgi:hypothetical protein
MPIVLKKSVFHEFPAPLIGDIFFFFKFGSYSLMNVVTKFVKENLANRQKANCRETREP